MRERTRCFVKMGIISNFFITLRKLLSRDSLVYRQVVSSVKEDSISFFFFVRVEIILIIISLLRYKDSFSCKQGFDFSCCIYNKYKKYFVQYINILYSYIITHCIHIV